MRVAGRAARRALDAAFALDDRVLVEDVVVGREIDVAVLGRPAADTGSAPALEIVVDGLFDYDAKYDGSADFRAPRAADRRSSARRWSAPPSRCSTRWAARGVARVDFFLTEDGPVLNEVNTMPGFTEHSQVPKMFAADGLVLRRPARPAGPRRAGGVSAYGSTAWISCAGSRSDWWCCGTRSPTVRPAPASSAW